MKRSGGGGPKGPPPLVRYIGPYPTLNHPMRLPSCTCFASCAVLVLAVLLPAPARAQLFTDASNLLDVQTRPGASTWAAGVLDVNADGYLDIYQPGRLYVSHGAAAGFTASFDSLLGQPYKAGFVFGATWADVDDDGFPEGYESVLLGGASRFYRNRAGMRLEDDTGASGIDFDGLAQGVVFADLNGDGPIDIFIGDDLGGGQVYFGDGMGQFVASTQNAELGAFIEKAYGVAAADYDGDGDLDIFIGACDVQTREKSVNLLLRNRGDGTFDEVGLAAGVAHDGAAWGVEWLDYDSDGWLDVYVANMPASDGRNGANVLYHNNGDGTFTDVTVNAGVSGPSTAQTFGIAAADFNNDGHTDLYAATQLGGAASLFRNNGDGTFTDVYAEAGLLVSLGGNPPAAHSHLSVAAGDFNRDGRMDLFQGSNTDPLNRVMLNTDPAAGHWVTVRLNQPAPNRDAVGARLDVFVSLERRLVREVLAGQGFISQHSGAGVHVGLGDADRIDSLVIRWPDGQVERHVNLGADQHLVIGKGRGIDAPPSAAQPDNALVTGNHIMLTWTPGNDPDGGGAGNPDNRALEYQVALQRPTGEVMLSEWTSATTYELLVDASPGGRWRWSVVTRDASTVIRSTTAPVFETDAVSTEDALALPAEFALTHAYPNPVRGASAGVTLVITSRGVEDVRLEVFDMLGRRVQEGVLRRVSSGETRHEVDLTGVSAGHYMLRLTGVDTGRQALGTILRMP